ncbi:hypothetical protein ABFA07_023594 [Porites harrisoni]
MKFLILLSILCTFCQDLVEVTGKELKDCPKCPMRPVMCYVDPCMSNPCVAPNTVCKPCYCEDCNYTCDQQLKG